VGVSSAPTLAPTRARPRDNDLELLFARVAGERPTLTPGELYRRMSAEFKERRARNHGHCVMPMVVCRTDSALSVNWGLEPLTARCLQCEPLALGIAWRYAERYDVWMPEAQPSLAAPQ
jgi:hypothetical protein